MELFKNQDMTLELCGDQKSELDLCVNDSLDLKVIKENKAGGGYVWNLVALRSNVDDIRFEVVGDLQEFELRHPKEKKK